LLEAQINKDPELNGTGMGQASSNASTVRFLSRTGSDSGGGFTSGKEASSGGGGGGGAGSGGGGGGDGGVGTRGGLKKAGLSALRVWVECRHDPITLVSSLARRLKQQKTMSKEEGSAWDSARQGLSMFEEILTSIRHVRHLHGKVVIDALVFPKRNSIFRGSRRTGGVYFEAGWRLPPSNVFDAVIEGGNYSYMVESRGAGRTDMVMDGSDMDSLPGTGGRIGAVGVSVFVQKIIHTIVERIRQKQNHSTIFADGRRRSTVVFVCAAGTSALKVRERIVYALRSAGIPTASAYDDNPSAESQLAQAEQIGASWTLQCIVSSSGGGSGGNDLSTGTAFFEGKAELREDSTDRQLKGTGVSPGRKKGRRGSSELAAKYAALFIHGVSSGGGDKVTDAATTAAAASPTRRPSSSVGAGADDVWESAHDIVFRLQDHRGWEQTIKSFSRLGAVVSWINGSSK
jgi:hypothetical protein